MSVEVERISSVSGRSQPIARQTSYWDEINEMVKIRHHSKAETAGVRRVFIGNSLKALHHGRGLLIEQVSAPDRHQHKDCTYADD